MARLFSGHDKIGQNRDHRAIHRHRHRHFVERDAVKQDFHILDRINGHTGLAHIPHHAGVITVIAAVGGQIKCHRHALLPRRQRLAVKGIAFLCRGKPCILPDGPRAARIHGGFHPAGKRRLPRQGAQMGQAGHILVCINRLHVDPFKGVPCQVVQGAVAQFGLGRFSPFLFFRCHIHVLLHSGRWRG